MSPHAAAFDDALRALAFVFGWSGGIMEVRVWRDGRPDCSCFFRMGEPGSARQLVSFIRWLDERSSPEVTLGVPAVQEGGGVLSATAFWAHVEGTQQNRWLERFKPAPSIVLREGGSSRRWAVWALEHPVRWAGIDKGNRRIAHRLGAPKKWAEPERLWLPAPGTCIRRGVTRPVPVVVERVDAVSYDPLAVVGRLKDPPPADAWMNRRTA